MKKNELPQLAVIQNRIYDVRGQKVMFDYDLAELYEVETRVLNQAIKRNLDSFPRDFMFRLTRKEWINMSSQIVMTYPGRRPKIALPYAFTEHGVTMLSSVLKSLKARRMNIAIVRAFIALKKFVLENKDIVEQLKQLKTRINTHDIELQEINKIIEKLLYEKTKRDDWNNRERIGYKKKK